MPRNPVIENTCDRCTRSWYTKADDKQIEVELKVSYGIGGNLPLVADFKCLCEGCQKTVLGLVESITKVMTKSAPIRGAKKAAGEVVTPPTAPGTKSEPPVAKLGDSVTIVSPSAGNGAKVASSAVPAPPSVAPSSPNPKR